MKKVDINFLINIIHYFEEHRDKNLEVFNNFYKRIDFFLLNSNQNQKLSKDSISFYVKFKKLLSLVFRLFMNLPNYINQALSLRFSRCKKITSCEAFAISSNRLDFDFRESIATQLVHMTELAGGGNVLNLFSRSGDEQKQKTIILYDTLLECKFWKRSMISNNEKLFIFDGAFIIFFSLCLLVSGVFFRGAEEFKFLRQYLKQTKVSKNLKGLPIYIRIIQALTFISYHGLISRMPKHITSLLTSNSFLVELLRGYILQNEESGKIVELLHGTIAVPTESWFKRLLSFQDTAKQKKHYLILQVPNLPELGTLNNKYFLGNNVSINVHLNTTLYKGKKFYGSYNAYALNQLKHLRLKPHDKGLTLTFYGGTNIGENFFNSSAFGVELKILYKIIDYFLKKKIDIKIIYVKHPKHKIIPSKATGIFNQLNVQMLDNSIFTYFITDYCISNISSCLFELNWLGAECFSPIIEADGFYCKNYLETIHHPKADGIKALENSLYGCLNAGLGGGSKSYIEKFNKRLKIAKGDNVN